MVLTTKFIEDNFRRFNADYFDGKLITPMFAVSNKKMAFGTLQVGNKRSTKEVTYKMSVSDYYIRSEQDIQNTILHEMIHLYIRQNGLRERGDAHGKLFQSIADKINKHGWNVTTKTSSKNLVPKTKTLYNMVAFIDANGKPFLMRYSRTKKSNLIRWFIKQGVDDNSVIWFVSDNIHYDGFPLCVKRIRGKYISDDEYNGIKKS